VVARAQEILANLERTEFDREGRPRIARSDALPPSTTRQLPLFASADDGIIDDLKKLDVDHLTPMAALSLLAELKKRLS
jgi:DNA mismatch repair protein MutS